jgi:hypothetical protein
MTNAQRQKRINALVAMINAAIRDKDWALFSFLDAQHRELCFRRNWEAVYEREAKEKAG